MTFKNNRKSKPCLDKKVSQFCFFSTVTSFWQTIRIRRNFLRNILLHRHKRKDHSYLDKLLAIFLKTGTYWEELKLITKIWTFLQNIWRKVSNEHPIFDTTLLNSLKQFQRNTSRRRNDRIELIYLFEVKNLFLVIFSKFGNIDYLWDVINSALYQERSEYAIKYPISNSTTLRYLWLVFHFWSRFFKIMKVWLISNNSLWRHSKS